LISLDANGNTLSDARGRSYTWDFENRLTEAVVPGTNGGTTTFKYDPFGRRIQKSGPLGTTNYLYDGPNIVEEADQVGSLIARYAQSRVLDEPLAEFSSGAISYYLSDSLDSITSLTNSLGVLGNTYAYDSFGRLSASTGGTLLNPLQFTGREFDSETGLYNYRVRYYDPQAGRFISEDPVRFKSGGNFYRYVVNNPVLLTDPFGLAPKSSGGGWWQWIKNCWNDIFSCGSNPGAMKVGPAPFNLCNAGDIALYSGSAPNNPYKKEGGQDNSAWKDNFTNDCEDKAPPGKTNYAVCSVEPISYGGTSYFCYCCQHCDKK
jgi:RHS repeat-associated protein